MRRSRSRRAGSAAWIDLPKQELLELPIRELDLRIEGTALEARIARLHDELGRRGLRFRPHVWLSTDWFTPDPIPGFAIPFYLAHPRLVRLEHSMMFEAEGAAHAECMKILRHETGHAIDNAYRLRRKKRWRAAFGSSAAPYRDSYVTRPSSRDFVQHLGMWYAQSHPLEDFAETFAVWLAPRAGWRKRYRGWPALRKLEFVDDLMAEVGDLAPLQRSRARPDDVSRLGITLAEHYRARRARWARDPSADYDSLLLRVFTPGGSRKSAATFLVDHRTALRNRVAGTTGHHRYVVDQTLKILIVRCRELGLRLARREADSRIDAAIAIAILTERFAGRRREFVR